MSRPNWSVPSRCVQLGASIMAWKSFSSGSNGASTFGKGRGQEHHDHDDEADRAERLTAKEIQHRVERRFLARQRVVGEGRRWAR